MSNIFGSDDGIDAIVNDATASEVAEAVVDAGADVFDDAGAVADGGGTMWDLLAESGVDTVWLDLDADGTVDPGEVGFAGITVTAEYTGPDGSIVTVVETTDTSGVYSVGQLPFDTPITVTVDDAALRRPKPHRDQKLIAPAR